MRFRKTVMMIEAAETSEKASTANILENADLSLMGCKDSRERGNDVPDNEEKDERGHFGEIERICRPFGLLGEEAACQRGTVSAVKSYCRIAWPTSLQSAQILRGDR